MIDQFQTKTGKLAQVFQIGSRYGICLDSDDFIRTFSSLESCYAYALGRGWIKSLKPYYAKAEEINKLLNEEIIL